MTSTNTPTPPNSIINSINAKYNKSVDLLVRDRNSKAASILNSRINSFSKRNDMQMLDKNFRSSLSVLNDIRAKSIVSYKTNYKALVVGCNYKNTPYELTGCVKDADSVKSFLVSKGVKEQNVFVLTDDSNIQPTRDNIIQAFIDLLDRSVSGETLIFSYSGHGSLINTTNFQKPSITTHEDNVLVSLDLRPIIDNDFNAIIKTRLKKDVTLFALFDCCHSRTMFDLQYNYDISSNDYLGATTMPAEEDLSQPVYISDADSVGDTSGQVFFISGCLDDQTSAEASIEGITQGAMTWAYLTTMKKYKQMSWKKLIYRMQKILKGSDFTQIPQFSTGIKCDLNSTCLYSL